MKISKDCRNTPESNDYLAFLQSYDAVGLRLSRDFFSFKKTNVYTCINVACPKSPVTHTFYSERIAVTNNSYSCRIIGHSGTYFTVQNDTHFNDLTATVTLVTISRHDRSKSNYAKCFRNFYFSQPAKST